MSGIVLQVIIRCVRGKIVEKPREASSIEVRATMRESY
jgi:hypothetical protein